MTVQKNRTSTVWDITNLSIGGASLVYNISEGNYGYAIVDAAGLAYDAVAVFFPFLPAGASASLEAYRAGNTLKQSLVIGSDMVEATKIANKASKNLDNIVEGNARLTGSRIHRETGVLLGEKSGKAESLSELANSYFKGTNGYIGKQPDLSWRGSSVWADLTTAKQWHAHIRTYENSHGLGTPILYSPGKGVVNFPQLRTGGVQLFYLEHQYLN